MIDPLLGRRNARVLQQLDGPLARLGRADRQVRQDGLGELAAHGVERAERGQRVLEDGADTPPRMWRISSCPRWSIRWPSSTILARGHAARGFEQADDGRTRERLARAGLAHHAQDLAEGNGKRNIVQRAQGTATARKFDNEVLTSRRDISVIHSSVRCTQRMQLARPSEAQPSKGRPAASCVSSRMRSNARAGKTQSGSGVFHFQRNRG